MNIPQSVITPFEPHGLPKLVLQKQWSESTLAIILDVMNALDRFMKYNADNCLAFAPAITESQRQALADHLCEWLEKTAMDAGADIVNAKARAVWEFDDIVEAIREVDTDKIPPPKPVGFMFLIDFTVNDEDTNHLIQHTFEDIPE